MTRRIVPFGSREDRRRVRPTRERHNVADESEFDPYYVWLGITREEQPPNFYRLLDVRIYESDLSVIDIGFHRRMAYLRGIKDGSRLDAAERLKNELTNARLCLMRPEKKALYDEELRRRTARDEALRDEIRRSQIVDFRREVERAFHDGVVDEREREELHQLARRMNLPGDVAVGVYNEVKAAFASRADEARRQEQARLAAERTRALADAEARRKEDLSKARRHAAGEREPPRPSPPPRNPEPIELEFVRSPTDDGSTGITLLPPSDYESAGRQALPPSPNATTTTQNAAPHPTAPHQSGSRGVVPPPSVRPVAPRTSDRVTQDPILPGRSEGVERRIIDVRSSIEMWMTISCISNLFLALVYGLAGALAVTCVGMVFGLPWLIVGISEARHLSKSSRHLAFATGAATIGVFECVVGVCNPLSFVAGLIVINRSNAVIGICNQFGVRE